MFRKPLVLAQEYLAFVLLNLFDLFLTGYIFRHSGEEANGLAALVLRIGHHTGFAIFKFIMLAAIIILIETIAQHNLQRAKQVLYAAIAIYVGVIIWESYLILTYIDCVFGVSDGFIIESFRRLYPF
jgi:hypothetical protein